MPAFPQLLSGAMAQLPAERAVRYRARRNRLANGAVLEAGDLDFEEREWDLVFRELNDAEFAALEALFAASRGRAGVFTFLEPGANLLRWSENLGLSPWVVNGSLVENQADPLGGNAATRIQASGSATQTLAVPSSYRYAASVWLRSTGPGGLVRVSDGGSTVFETPAPASGQWARHVIQYQSASSTDTISLSLLSGSASPLEVFGPQLEAQAAPSAYKRTAARGGVFANTRFNQDTLVDQTTGPGRHDTRVRLLWTPLQA